MPGTKLERALLSLLAVVLVLVTIGLLVSLSRQRGEGIKATSAVDNYGCLTCHGDPSYRPKTSSRPWPELHVKEATLAASTHRSIGCTDCHTTFDTGQRIEPPAVQALCGRCHARELALQEASVHSDAKVTTCLKCHSPGDSGHDVQPVLSAASPVFAKNVPQTCASCHADRQLMARYDLKADVYDVFLDTPHGKVMKLTGSGLGGLRPATCTSCHGSHDVIAVDDPKSPVRDAASRARLCGTCHPGATENFVRSLAVHQEPTPTELPLVFYGERFFFVLTASVVSLGLLIVGLEGFGWLRRRGDGPGSGFEGPGGNPGNPGSPGGNPSNPGNPGGVARQASAVDLAPSLVLTAEALPVAVPSTRPAQGSSSAPAATLPNEIVRFDINQRLQHIVMMVSFLTLAFTGLPQKFPDWEVSQWLISMWGGLDSARAIHRFAGLVMITVCFYHLAYVAYSTAVLKRPFPIWMIPIPRDVADFFQDLRYWFGRSQERPKFGRFSYREKFDYWAIFWGMPVMGISGLILMFTVLASKVLPGDIISVAFVAHSDEAVLAVLWIFVVHFFFVHINPRFFPLNRAMFTGKMPRHLYAEEHPLELERLDAGKAFTTNPDGADRRAGAGK